MADPKNITILKALQKHLLALKKEDATPIFREVKILPWAFRKPDEIRNYGTDTNLFPAAYLVPGDDRRENGNGTGRLHIDLLLFTASFPGEEEALAKFTLLQKALESFNAVNGRLPEVAGGYVSLESSSPEEFPGDFVGIMASLEVYYAK